MRLSRDRRAVAARHRGRAAARRCSRKVLGCIALPELDGAQTQPHAGLPLICPLRARASQRQGSRCVSGRPPRRYMPRACAASASWSAVGGRSVGARRAQSARHVPRGRLLGHSGVGMPFVLALSSIVLFGLGGTLGGPRVARPWPMTRSTPLQWRREQMQASSVTPASFPRCRAARRRFAACAATAWHDGGAAEPATLDTHGPYAAADLHAWTCHAHHGCGAICRGADDVTSSYPPRVGKPDRASGNAA